MGILLYSDNYHLPAIPSAVRSIRLLLLWYSTVDYNHISLLIMDFIALTKIFLMKAMSAVADVYQIVENLYCSSLLKTSSTIANNSCATVLFECHHYTDLTICTIVLPYWMGIYFSSPEMDWLSSQIN